MKPTQYTFFDNKSKVLLALLLPALILYAKSLKFGFTSMDEQWMIVKDSVFLQNWSSIITAFTTSTTDVYYRPLFMISLIIDYHLGKLAPGIYHFSNLMWHLLSVVLLFKFLVKSEVEKKRAFFLSLLFSVHPVLLHAVAWVPGRNDIMLGVFTLASLIYLKKYIDTASRKNAGLHLLFFTCALFTKESAVVLPFLFFAYYFTLKNEDKKRIIPLILSWIALTSLWLVIRNSVSSETSSSAVSMTTISQNMLGGFLLFFGKVLLPFQQSVLPTLKNSSLTPGILSLFLFGFLIYKPGLKNKKIAFFGIFMFFLLLLIPVWFGASKSNGEHYEQRIYGAMAGIFLFLGQLKLDFESKTVKYLAAAVLILFTAKTFIRMNVYKNENTYVDAGIKESPGYYLFPMQKADLLNAKRDFKNAIIFYNKALEIRPDYPQGLSNRGSAYFSSGQYKEAAEDYTQAIQHSDFNKTYYLNRLSAYSRAGDAAQAMKDLIVLKKCCQELVKPELEKRVMDKWLADLDLLKQQLNGDRKNAKLYFKIATLYHDIEMKKEAEAYLNQAILLDPTNTEYTNFMNSHKS